MLKIPNHLKWESISLLIYHPQSLTPSSPAKKKEMLSKIKSTLKKKFKSQVNLMILIGKNKEKLQLLKIKVPAMLATLSVQTVLAKVIV